jgi:hypothetical protein
MSTSSEALKSLLLPSQKKRKKGEVSLSSCGLDEPSLIVDSGTFKFFVRP